LDEPTAIQLSKPILQLVGGSERNPDMTRQLRIGVEAAAFRDVQMNRFRSANKLIPETRAIAMTETLDEGVHAIRNGDRELPYFELSVVAHSDQDRSRDA
jgi:hypothetical protein